MADGFGYSNFLKLYFKYKDKNTKVGRGDATQVFFGDFKLIDEQKVQDSSSEDDRYALFEAVHPKSKQKFLLQFIYIKETSHAKKYYEKYMKDSDFVVYQGHSGFGDNIETFKNVNFDDKYQSFLMVACSSLNYGTYPIYHAKKKSSPAEKGKNWDLIGSKNAAPLFSSEETLEAYIDFYTEAWLLFGEDKSLSEFTYKKVNR